MTPTNENEDIDAILEWMSEYHEEVKERLPGIDPYSSDKFVRDLRKKHKNKAKASLERLMNQRVLKELEKLEKHSEELYAGQDWFSDDDVSSNTHLAISKNYLTDRIAQLKDIKEAT